METKSFKQMIQAGDIKRADAMKSLLDDIHEEAGFNVRTLDDAFWAGIKQFAEYIAAGGTYPPLEVRPRPGGGVYLVEGHRRRLALIMARDVLRAPIEWVNVVAFNGNDADRVVRIATSATQQPLTPLEMAQVYKRLAAFGLSADDIAGKVGKTRQHVDQLLILANANTDVHKLVAAGGVSAAVAVDITRKHGENAGKIISDELAKAKAAGKGKVTAGTMKPKALPPKIVHGLVDELDAFMGGISTLARSHLVEAEKAQARGEDVSRNIVTVPAAALLSLVNEFAKVAEVRAKQSEKMRAKAEKAAQGELA